MKDAKGTGYSIKKKKVFSSTVKWHAPRLKKKRKKIGFEGKEMGKKKRRGAAKKKVKIMHHKEENRPIVFALFSPRHTRLEKKHTQTTLQWHS